MDRKSRIVEVKENKCELEHLRLISTSLEKIMCREGFDILRVIWTNAIPFIEWVESEYQVIQSNFWNKVKIYGSIEEGFYYPINIPCERDIDIIKIIEISVAVENPIDITQYDSNTVRCLIENDQFLPGYCYLRVINEGSAFCSPNDCIQYIASSAIQRYAQMNLTSAPSHLLRLLPDFFRQR
ncbi:hypothetical protein CHS0354_017163 [Potamilus streckersoni]|uniref:Uncharacterized protein n=1 Tax=Potamilus streckersoni TaxID=2493646 RepID=A0AAE0T2P9_9BIVA|nr:hypothetical protein CHS0354_017163 [Potamilus streckersoni]